MKGQLLSIVLIIIFVITTSSISSSNATPPCMPVFTIDVWNSYDDIYTGKIISNSTHTDDIQDDLSLNIWEREAEIRLDIELEYVLKGNGPTTTWYKYVPLETFCPGDFCVDGADRYPIGTMIYYIENNNDNMYGFGESCLIQGSGDYTTDLIEFQQLINHYEIINRESLTNINGELVEKVHFKFQRMSEMTNLRGETVTVSYYSLDKLYDRGYLVGNY